ncbi:MAG: hypothetical protein NTU54_00230 [Candidatus Omnitrophica bacterium]|nr:hypothetical protein [Candidatus Omnitrophota bacterium]
MKIRFLLLIFIPAFLFLKPAFASPRDEIISLTLDQVESVYAKGVTFPSEELIPNQTSSDDFFSENQNRPAPLAESQGSYSSENNLPLDGKLSISAGYNGNHMRYRETEGRDVLDEDYGSLNGFYLGMGFKSDNYIQEIMAKPYFEAYFRDSDALIKYKGRYGAGHDFAFNKEHADIQRFGLKIGGYTDFTDKGEVLGYLDIGERIWKRGKNQIIDGVSDYAEKYSWTYLGLGLGVNYALFPKFTTGIDAEWMFALKSRMRADSGEGDTFGIKNVNGFELKLPLKYYFLKNLSFDFTPYLTYWSIGKSDYIIKGNFESWEPDSKTHIEGVLAGFTYTL